MEDMIDEGGGTETQCVTQGDNQTTAMDIKDEPFLAPQATEGPRGTGRYTELEDVCLCEAWMEIGQDPIYGAQQKGGIYNYFHEQKHLGDHPFVSDQSVASPRKKVTVDLRVMHQVERLL
jgi:hypothetical protein